MAMSFLRGLGDGGRIHQLNLSRNEIGELAGRSLSTFITKSTSLRKLDISQNPLLKVTANQALGQQRIEEDSKKPGAGNKKDKKKVYIPGCYLITVALGKSTSMKEIRMIGLIVNHLEWEKRLAPLGNRVKVLYTSPDSEPYNFRPKGAAPPPRPKPPPPPPAKGKGKGKAPVKSTARSKRK
jgi:hypothetical protein